MDFSIFSCQTKVSKCDELLGAFSSRVYTPIPPKMEKNQNLKLKRVYFIFILFSFHFPFLILFLTGARPILPRLH